MNRFDFTITTDEGYTYRPFTNGHAVGFIVSAPNGKREFLFLNPSGATDNGFADVAVYLGEVDADVVADDDGYVDDDAIYDPQAMTFISPFDVDTTADTLARKDMARMCIGAEPTPEEIALRAAEHADYLTLEIEGLDTLPESVKRTREAHEGEEILDMDRVMRWLHLYGVPAHIEHGGGNIALLIADGRVSIGPGWYEGPHRTSPHAGTGDCYLTTDEDDDDATVNVHYGELETAWSAMNMLAGRPVFTTDGTGRRQVVKPTRVGLPITA